MALLQFDQIGIKGLAAAVPANKILNLEYTEHFSQEEVSQIVEKTGIYERRFAPLGMTASDLCYAAANRLITDMEIDRDQINALIFVSQTADFRMPATSVVLQHRLSLPTSTLAFDVNLGCSAYVYGLTIAYSLLQQPHIHNVLLLDGETRSRVYHPKDRKTALIFGDAGVATLISKASTYGKSYFSLNSDGSRENVIKIDSGGYRNPSSFDSLKEKVVDEYGNIRTDEHGYMNGADVFNFAIREVPKSIHEILAFAEVSKESVDYFVLHQANQYMNSYLAKKMQLPSNKVPTNLDRFGNTSSVSIPLAIVTELNEVLSQPKCLLLSGFGVGMSWATAVLNMGPCHIPRLIELEQ